MLTSDFAGEAEEGGEGGEEEEEQGSWKGCSRRGLGGAHVGKAGLPPHRHRLSPCSASASC